MDKLTLTLVQADLSWEDAEANFFHLDNLIQSVPDTDLIILPEMFPTGFSMQPAHLYDLPEGKTLQWMQNLASERDAAVTGSVIIKDGGVFYNRLYFVFPSGEYQIYNKRHLFTLAGEEKVYSAGKKHLLVEYMDWKIMPLICYDLRFPVWCRNIYEADLQIFVANWPERRVQAWQSLLKARAIENMCYVAGVNRIGNDGNGIHHSGDSVIHDELGNDLLRLTPSKEEVKTFSIEKSKMLQSRNRFGFLHDRDHFLLT